MQNNSGQKLRVLVAMPNFPMPEVGAERQERAAGIRQLVRLGCDVVVIAKTSEWIDREAVEASAEKMGVRVMLVPYRFSNRTLSIAEKITKFVGRFRHPLYFDGAAYEYAEPRMQAAYQHELDTFQPDIAWFEYTYLWPLYASAKRARKKIITRSQNFEAKHFLQEDGRTFFNYLKYIPKYFGERRAARMSDALFAITPSEEKIYRALGSNNVATLPLRSLAPFTLLVRPVIRDRKPLHVFCMGSAYTVAHNRAAARLVITEVVPAIARQAPGSFIFHILGGKLPQELVDQCDGISCIYEGYVADLESFLVNMDIALVPSVMGAGMQQKVFEPIVRGIPTITSSRAIAGYLFTAGKDFLDANTAAECVEALLLLQSPERRTELSRAASESSAKLFSQENLDAPVLATLVALR